MVVWVTMRLSNHLYILPYIWTNNWMIIRSAALSFLCADTRLKIRVSSLNRYLFCDSRSCPNNQSCRNIQQGKTLRFRCPLQSAPVRTDGFFLPRNGCNIAPGTDPAMETVTEDFQNFSQRFSGADFCCRQTTASCTFVRQIDICPTKVLALRGRGRSRVATLFLAIYGYQPKTDRHNRQEAPNTELQVFFPAQ